MQIRTSWRYHLSLVNKTNFGKDAKKEKEHLFPIGGTQTNVAIIEISLEISPISKNENTYDLATTDISFSSHLGLI